MFNKNLTTLFLDLLQRGSIKWKLNVSRQNAHVVQRNHFLFI